MFPPEKIIETGCQLFKGCGNRIIHKRRVAVDHGGKQPDLGVAIRDDLQGVPEGLKPCGHRHSFPWTTP